MGKPSSMSELDIAKAQHEVYAGEARIETNEQLAKWGVQNHPALHSENARRDFAKLAEKWKSINDARVRDGSIAWDGILLEEVFEALELTDPFAMIDELVQVAAVAISMAASIERNNRGPDPVTVLSSEAFDDFIEEIEDDAA